jgi:hypothetical protein
MITAKAIVSTEALKKAVDGVIALKQGKATVGWLESAKYPNGTSVAYVATIQEFGYAKGGIPPRPFWRPTIINESAKWRKLAEQQFKKIINGSATVHDLFEAVGAKASGDIRRAISKVTAPPLSPVTLQLRVWKKKGMKIGGTQVRWARTLVAKGVATTTGVNAHPLADTGVMMQTLTNVTE